MSGESEKPLRDVLREVDATTAALASAANGGPPSMGYEMGTAVRLARELRALAPLLRRLIGMAETDGREDVEAYKCASALADELEAR